MNLNWLNLEFWKLAAVKFWVQIIFEIWEKNKINVLDGIVRASGNVLIW